jgi:hypothetical protein
MEIFAMKTPISWIIDDPAPIVSVYYEVMDDPVTADGRPLIPTYPNEALYEFCDIIEKYGIRGKFSVVPMPGNRGDIINGVEGGSKEELDVWLDCVKKRVIPAFSVGPEMLSHNKAVDLKTGEALPLNERDWASTQDRTTLVPYISKALFLLKEAGLETIGVTSPWNFGIEVEDEYEHSISLAVEQVTGSKKAWFFLRGLRDTPNAKPWIALEEDGRTLVSIPATLRDNIWQTIDTTRCDDEYISEVADVIITADGKDGTLMRVLETGGYPILITHWQSLMSNGLYTGLKVMDEIAARISRNLSDRVEWMSFEEITDMVLENKENYPKRIF